MVILIQISTRQTGDDFCSERGEKQIGTTNSNSLTFTKFDAVIVLQYFEALRPSVNTNIKGKTQRFKPYVTVCKMFLNRTGFF